MNDCRQLHETVVKDIVDVISDIKNFDQIDWINNRNSTGSIAKRASNLVLVFPVIVSLCTAQSAPTVNAICFKIFACAIFKL